MQPANCIGKEPAPPSGGAGSDLSTCLAGVPPASVEDGAAGVAPAVSFGSGRRYSVLKGLRDAQYGSVKLVQLQGASPSTLVLKSYHRSLVTRRFGRLSKNIIYEDAHSELTIWAQLTSAGGHPNVSRLLDIGQNEVRWPCWKPAGSTSLGAPPCAHPASIGTHLG